MQTGNKLYLVESCSKLLEGENAQCVLADGNDALRTLLGGEARGVGETFVAERGQVEAVLVVV